MTVELVSDYLVRGAPASNKGLVPDVLVAESNHRIANNLTLIAGLIRLQAAAVSKAGKTISAEEACLMLEEAGARIETVGRLHRLLADAESGATVDLGRYLGDIAAAAIDSMARAGDMRLTQASGAPCEISTHRALPVGLIVGELVTNAVKYAHPTGVGGHIELGCHRRPGGATLIQIVDDGVGLPEGFDPRLDGGLGMRMVRNLADQLGATLSFDLHGVGLAVRLLMPPNGPVEAR